MKTQMKEYIFIILLSLKWDATQSSSVYSQVSLTAPPPQHFKVVKRTTFERQEGLRGHPRSSVFTGVQVCMPRKGLPLSFPLPSLLVLNCTQLAVMSVRFHQLGKERVQQCRVASFSNSSSWKPAQKPFSYSHTQTFVASIE